MRIIIEVNAEEAKDICENEEGADKILQFLKDEVNRIETFEGDEYKTSITIKTV